MSSICMDIFTNDFCPSTFLITHLDGFVEIGEQVYFKLSYYCTESVSRLSNT